MKNESVNSIKSTHDKRNKTKPAHSLTAMDGSSGVHIAQEKLSNLKKLFPEIFTEGKVDPEKLRLTIGEDLNIQNERYVLNWAGKSDAFRVLQTPTTATLAPTSEGINDFNQTQNVFIEGENLEVLKILQKSYYGKIKMIYIDPPYNTGSDEFIYPDKFSESKDDYLKRIGEKDEEGYLLKEGLFRKNSRESGQYHSNWLSMMYPRLFLARNLLKDDGVIFVSIDDNEVHNLRLLMNEVFGEENFVTQFVWNSSTGGGIRSKYVNQSHEYALCYSKNIDCLPMFFSELSPEAIKQYNKKDEKGIYREKDFAWRNEGNNPNQQYYITCPDGSKVKPQRGYMFRFIKGTFDEALKNNLVVFKQTDTGPLVNEMGKRAKYNIYIKKYLGNATGAPSSLIPKSIVGISNIGTEEIKYLFSKDIFNNPKSTRYLKYLIKIGLSNKDIILDFFAGSGTTAHAVLDLNKEDGGNRKFICVQLAEKCKEDSEAYKAGYKNIADICKARIRRVIKKIEKERKENPDLFAKAKKKEIASSQACLDGSPAPRNDTVERDSRNDNIPDLGFKVFKLKQSNFKIWRGDVIENGKDLARQMDAFEEPVKPEAKASNMVWEIMLKSGYDLNTKIGETTVAGCPVYSGGMGLPRPDEESGLAMTEIGTAHV